MDQANLFERKQSRTHAARAEEIVLYALGDFQARDKVLAHRELPLDRLRGALRRASEFFNAEELSDEEATRTLARLGAEIKQVPSFVAKHPFRVTVKSDLAERARNFYEDVTTQQNAET